MDLVAFLCLAVLAADNKEDAQATDYARALQDVRQNLIELSNHFRDLQEVSGARKNWTSKDAPDAPKPIYQWWEFRRTGNNLAVNRISPDKTGLPGKELASVANAKYEFQAVRSSADKPWVLLGVGAPQKAANNEYYGGVAFGYPDVAFAIYGIPLADLFNEPNFKVKNISKSPDRIRIEFDYPDVKYSQLNGMRGGWVVLLPKQGGAIGSYELRLDEGKTVGATMEYDGESPKKALHTYHYPSGEEYFEFDFTKYEFGSLPDEDFTLRHYGLPEEIGVGASPRSIGWLLPLNILAVMCLAIALYLRRYSARTA